MIIKKILTQLLRLDGMDLYLMSITYIGRFKVSKIILQLQRLTSIKYLTSIYHFIQTTCQWNSDDILLDITKWFVIYWEVNRTNILIKMRNASQQAFLCLWDSRVQQEGGVTTHEWNSYHRSGGHHNRHRVQCTLTLFCRQAWQPETWKRLRRTNGKRELVSKTNARWNEIPKARYSR